MRGQGEMSDTEDTGLSARDRLAWAGRLGAPLAAIGVYALFAVFDSDLQPAGQATAAIGVLMAILWMTEALPLPVTSLLPIVLFPVTGVLTISEVTAPYANEIIFLFMGGFMLALAMQKWGLHRRIALHIVLVVGTRPRNLIGGFMIATAFLSMWISNTATTVLMLPIAVSIITLLLERLGSLRERPATDDEPDATPKFANAAPLFATGLMLAVAYSASIGSAATLIGTPPNLFMRAFLERTYGIEIGFGQWMLVGLPFAGVFLVIAWLLITRVLYPPEIKVIPGGDALIRGEMASLGPMSRGERVVLVVFSLTASAWVLREPLTNWSWLVERVPWIQGVSDPAIAIAAAVLLFSIPVNVRRQQFALDWDSARRLPWNVLILFGGGLSLAAAVQASGLDAWIGQHATAFEALPLVLLVAATVVVVVLLTELTSNTATAATFLPILSGVAIGIGIDAMLLVVPAALAATCAFMMPVATPPNAIVFGSGYLSIGQMVRAGIWLNLIAVVLIVLITFTLATIVLGIAW
jgi:solute carrier family 13 (sodium-dependent dicarboxylate transporter), member 2/3/5